MMLLLLRQNSPATRLRGRQYIIRKIKTLPSGEKHDYDWWISNISRVLLENWEG